MKCKFRCSYPELIHLSLPDHGDSDTEEDSINYRHFRDYLSIAIYMYLKWSSMIYSGWWTVLISNCTFKKSSLWPNRARLLYHTRIHIALTQLVIIQALKETSLGRAPYPWTAAESHPALITRLLAWQGKRGRSPRAPCPSQRIPFRLQGGPSPPQLAAVPSLKLRLPLPRQLTVPQLRSGSGWGGQGRNSKK